MKRVLWVDDEAYRSLGLLAAHAVMASDLDLTIATTYPAACTFLESAAFDAVVVDLCLSTRSADADRDGLTLIAAYLAPDFPLGDGIRKVPARRFGVMSVDVPEALRYALLAMGVDRIAVKSPRLAPDALVRLARELASR